MNVWPPALTIHGSWITQQRYCNVLCGCGSRSFLVTMNLHIDNFNVCNCTCAYCKYAIL